MCYMWRDIERRAAMYGLKVKVPVPYPLKEFDLANRLALLGIAEGWGKTFIVASYRRWFVDGHEPAVEPNLSASLVEAGQEVAQVVERAGSEDVMKAFLVAAARHLQADSKMSRVSQALSALQAQLDASGKGEDPLGLGTFIEIANRIDHRKVNVGYATRSLLMNGFESLVFALLDNVSDYPETQVTGGLDMTHIPYSSQFNLCAMNVTFFVDIATDFCVHH